MTYNGSVISACRWHITTGCIRRASPTSHSARTICPSYALCCPCLRQLSSSVQTHVRSPTHTPVIQGGGGGGSICPELGVAPLVDPGTDCEDELPAPADVPVVGNQDMDSELQSVFIDVVSLPTMITPVSDVDRALCAPYYAVTRPPTATTSAEPNLLSPIRSPASATAVGISSEQSTPPVAAVAEDFLLFNAAMSSQTQPETSIFPQVHAAGPDVGLVARGVTLGITDRPREGPFDAHHDRQGSTTSPQLLQETQGCLFRMTSYDAESDGPNFSPEHGVQLTDPRFLEYVGAPESERLMNRNPEYWVHHMGVENSLSAALQLQHDAGLVLSNVQVMQQLVTSMCRTSSDVLLAVHRRQPFPSSAVQQVMPSYRVRRAAYYMMAMGLWRPPVETVIRTPMSSVACNACTSCQDCCPRVPR